MWLSNGWLTRACPKIYALVTKNAAWALLQDEAMWCMSPACGQHWAQQACRRWVAGGPEGWPSAETNSCTTSGVTKDAEGQHICCNQMWPEAEATAIVGSSSRNWQSGKPE